MCRDSMTDSKAVKAPSWLWIPAAVFVVQLLHGATLGLTDDEAYYWVLAQKPAWGYAYHPPFVAWSIAASEALFKVVLGLLETLGLQGSSGLSSQSHIPAAVRLPAA